MNFYDGQIEHLIMLATKYNLKRLKVADIEIEPGPEAKDIATSLAAQEIASELFNVSDDKLLDDPYAGLSDALKSIKDQKDDEAN